MTMRIDEDSQNKETILKIVAVFLIVISLFLVLRWLYSFRDAKEPLPKEDRYVLALNNLTKEIESLGVKVEIAGNGGLSFSRKVTTKDKKGRKIPAVMVGQSLKKVLGGDVIL